MYPIGGSRGACQAHAPPIRDQILSFLHTFLPKSTHVGGPHPPNGSTPPLREILDLPLYPIRLLHSVNLIWPQFPVNALTFQVTYILIHQSGYKFDQIVSSNQNRLIGTFGRASILENEFSRVIHSSVLELGERLGRSVWSHLYKPEDGSNVLLTILSLSATRHLKHELDHLCVYTGADPGFDQGGAPDRDRPKTAILGPQFCRILVLGPHFWWSGGGPGPPGPPPGSAPGIFT